MTITIVADRGTHLLISDGKQCAVIERRNDHFYNCHDDRRTGISDIAAVGQILDSGDWTDTETARKTLDDVAERGTNLAERLR
jgi:hypothetical protein